MRNASLKAKLGMGFASLLIVLVAMGFVAYKSIAQMAEISERVDTVMVKKDMTSEIEAAVEKQSTGLRGFLMTGKADLLQHDEEGKREFAENMDGLAKLLVIEEGRRLHAEIRRNYDEFRATSDHEIELRRAGKTKEATELMFSAPTAEIRTNLRKAVADMKKLQDRLKEEALKNQAAVETRVRLTVMILAMGGVLAGLVLATLLTRSDSGNCG